MSIDIRKEKITTEDKEAIHRLWDAVAGDQSEESRIAAHQRLDGELGELEKRYGRKFTPTKYSEQNVIKRVGDYHCMRPQKQNDVEEDLKVWHPQCTEDPNDSCLLSRFDVLLGVLGTTMSEYLNPNRPRNAFFDTNAFYLTAGGQSSIDRLAIDIEKNSVWKLMP